MKRRNLHKGALIIIGVLLLILFITLTNKVGYWLAVSLLVGVDISLLYSIVAQLRKAFVRPSHGHFAKDFSLKLVATSMGFLLIGGMLLYFYVFYKIEQNGGCSLRMPNVYFAR